MPRVIIRKGCSVSAMALLTKSTESWGIYASIPAVRVEERNRDLLDLKQQFLDESK